MADDAGALREALKRVAVALKHAGVPFALAGGYAAYARGGPAPSHDIDFYLRADDVERAEKVLEDAGLRVEHPPEDWLVKVFHGTAMVDLIFAPTGMPVSQGVLDRASEVEVDAVCMPVLAATDVMVSKLLALAEHYCDFATLLPVARALREQVDWDRVRGEVGHNPYAAAFLVLAERLRVAPPGG